MCLKLQCEQLHLTSNKFSHFAEAGDVCGTLCIVIILSDQLLVIISTYTLNPVSLKQK